MSSEPLLYDSEVFWRRRSVLVTGCTGMLGSWLAIRLVELGANVVGLVRDHVPHSNLWRHPLGGSVTVIRGSLVDYDVMVRTVNEYEIDTVFHLGAQTIVPIANRSPMSTFDSNVRGTWTLLEAVRATPGVRATVVASSDKAYGESEELPYLETHRLEGKTPYDVSKVCTDLIAQTYHHHYAMPVCILRCGNLFGGGDLNWNRLIPGTIRACHFGEPVIVRSDGTPVRDYVYVRDAVDGYLAVAAGMERPETWGHAFNLSNANAVPVTDVVRLICAKMDVPYEPRVLDQARGEIRAQMLDSRKLREMLGWRSRWPLDPSLDETIVWYRDFLEDEVRSRPTGR